MSSRVEAPSKTENGISPLAGKPAPREMLIDPARLEKAYPAHLASVRKHIMDHLANIDLAAFTDAMARIAETDKGPPVRRIPLTSPA